ncbi:MDR/zinc-dependent alcohol dehydrogenase-like family protein, partial [Bordetella pertussis]|uniref:zinc-binding dehydrogenase n=1 Tax=Bordetella pertussis TaxID=520 RepID=UPI0018A6D02F
MRRVPENLFATRYRGSAAMTIGIAPMPSPRLRVRVQACLGDAGGLRLPGVAFIGSAGPGRRVAALATQAAAPGADIEIDAGQAWTVADGLDEQSALLLAVLWPSAWIALVEIGGLRAGQQVLVHEADTPLGLLATVLARHEGVLYGDPWPELAREHGGADLVFDPGAGRYAVASLPCARRRARMLALDMHDGPAGPPIGAAQLLRRQTSLAAAGWDLVRD